MWAILSIIAGWPFGIVATVYANRSTSLVASSQIGAATEASRKALRWMIASFLTLPLCLALMIGYALIARMLKACRRRRAMMNGSARRVAAAHPAPLYSVQLGRHGACPRITGSWTWVWYRR
jgi:uncharacterized membrane protein YjgN (DUF898 family)